MGGNPYAGEPYKGYREEQRRLRTSSKTVMRRDYSKGSITDHIKAATSEGELGGLLVIINQNFARLGGKTLKRIMKAYEAKKQELAAIHACQQVSNQA